MMHLVPALARHSQARRACPPPTPPAIGALPACTATRVLPWCRPSTHTRVRSGASARKLHPCRCPARPAPCCHSLAKTRSVTATHALLDTTALRVLPTRLAAVPPATTARLGPRVATRSRAQPARTAAALVRRRRTIARRARGARTAPQVPWHQLRALAARTARPRLASRSRAPSAPSATRRGCGCWRSAVSASRATTAMHQA